MLERRDATADLAHLRSAYDWLERSRSARYGGSRASFSVVRGWSRPYPETTGYIIPTVLEAGHVLGDRSAFSRALTYGTFLLRIQRLDGAWDGHLYPARHPAPSVFNTAQILKGMCALARTTGEERWRSAALRGARWLAEHLESDGRWRVGNYRSEANPTYYTQVAWPMLETAALSGDGPIREGAVLALEGYADRRNAEGLFSECGFGGKDLAFTHTIAYTLRGFLESARLLNQWARYGTIVVPALQRFRELALERRGKIGGAYYPDWRSDDRYVCLTGNAQLAICMLIVYERDGDARWIAGARALVDEVCRHHALEHPLPGVRGAVPGSAPLWGAYMRLRYPNWAAKYFCDALVRLIRIDVTD